MWIRWSLHGKLVGQSKKQEMELHITAEWWEMDSCSGAEGK